VTGGGCREGDARVLECTRAQHWQCSAAVDVPRCVGLYGCQTATNCVTLIDLSHMALSEQLLHVFG